MWVSLFLEVDMSIASQVSGFIFGSECLGCGKASGGLDPWLCPECVDELAREMKSYSSPKEGVYCLFPMRSLTRNLVHALKYKSIHGMAAYLVRRSAAVRDGAVGQEFALLPHPLYFVPVPLHRARMRERGYNQAEQIAAALALVTGGQVCRWLKRRTFVMSQTKLSREARERNVMGAFVARLPERLPEGGTVIIVDDVYTTGSTTSACVDALGVDFPLPLKVCTLLYDEPITAVADFVADNRMDWNYR